MRDKTPIFFAFVPNHRMNIVQGRKVTNHMTSNISDMDFPESHRDLLTAPVAVLATIGLDGFPQVTATWFLFDDEGVLRLSLNSTRKKIKNLQSHPECTLFILDPTNPYRTLEIRARAELSADTDYTFADKVSSKYDGADFRLRDRPGESRVIVTLKVVKINTYGTGS